MEQSLSESKVSTKEEKRDTKITEQNVEQDELVELPDRIPLRRERTEVQKDGKTEFANNKMR